MLQVQHLGTLCTRGIFKAPIEGAAVIDPRAGSLVVGQDVRAGYSGSDGVHYQMYLSESVVLKLDDPGAVCTISVAGGRARGRTKA